MIEHVNQLGSQTPRTGPPPTGDAVSVWSWDTTADVVGGYPVEEAGAVLDADERARAERMVQPADRHRYRASHLGLRVLLGSCLGSAPQGIRLIREDCPCCGGPHGRPAVADAAFHFSLSHSGDLAYLALAARPVGVDIEAIPGPQAVADVINALHPAETAELNALAVDQRPTALARLWARKEAVLKATGTGLAEGLTHPYVGSHPAPTHPPGWTLTDLPAPHDYRAALATTNDNS
ncbi:4'-phosphopantetheinyl transferase superfamily protein [Streptomyces sp. NPDC040724]|uniref:4'-phosphopantetheinyl transferase family protein n=1 Tax=Streptomyces sp. NPDC040724 TaxID=3155612 RepID=UPI0033C2BC69